MAIKETLDTKLKEYMRAGNAVALNTIRSVKTRISTEEAGTPKTGRVTFTEGGLVNIVRKEVTVREQAIEDARKAGRNDLVASNEQELEILRSLLPEQVGEAEIRTAAQKLMAELGHAPTMKDMGPVMKSLQATYDGKADGKVVSAIVKDLISSWKA